MTVTESRLHSDAAVHQQGSAAHSTIRGRLVASAAMKALLLAFTLLVIAVPAAAAAEPGILYSADARGVAVAKSGTELRLSAPAATPTTWFTDRPARRAGMTTLSDLVSIWGASGFREDPPNAALLLTHKGETRTHVVTLTNPRREDGRVSFRLRAVPGGAEAGHAHTHEIQPGGYGRAMLFIDDAAQPPCPASITQVPLTCISAPGQTVKVGLAPPSGKVVQTTVCWAADQPLPTDGVWGGGQGFIWRYFTDGSGTQGLSDIYGCNLFDAYSREIGDRPVVGQVSKVKNGGKVPLLYEWGLGDCAVKIAGVGYITAGYVCD